MNLKFILLSLVMSVNKSICTVSHFICIIPTLPFSLFLIRCVFYSAPSYEIEIRQYNITVNGFLSFFSHCFNKPTILIVSGQTYKISSGSNHCFCKHDLSNPPQKKYRGLDHLDLNCNYIFDCDLS